MDDIMSSWMGLCGEYVCSFRGLSVIGINLLLIFGFVTGLGCKVSRGELLFRLSSPLRIGSLAVNGCLGIVYLGFGLRQLGEKLERDGAFFPLGCWFVLLSQGVTLTVIGSMAGIRTKLPVGLFVRIWSGIACALAVLVCSYSARDFFVHKTTSIKLFLDVLTLPGAIMLVLCACRRHSEYEVSKNMDDDSLQMPLNGRSNGDSINYYESVTPFARAGFLSRMTFSWLNSVIKRGYEKPLEEKDIPQLSGAERAEGCYTLFLEQVERQKLTKKTASPSIFWTIVSCYRNEILVSGLFALLKVLTLSAGPVLLKAFIKVSKGEANFRYEGFVLALLMFFSKCLESMSQRQWYFRTRLLGIKVRSLLSAAIYHKQVKLSNSFKLTHSSGEIMNYVTVDAYRIGEFPYWFHQTWTTNLQLCIALMILYNAVGLATISAMIVIILTVLCNVPFAKLQHKFQSRLMKAQGARLKAMSEALVNMKVLKLYAWETHFKKVIEDFRAVELHWISMVQLRRAYTTFLFWSSPVLVSAATFLTCYFIDVPLYPTNVFTVVATLRLVQDPVRQIPNVIGVIIQAKVAFSRIVKFLDAPELQNGQSRRKYHPDLNHPITIKSATFNWDGTTSRSTLSNITLQVKVGEKVAICGEVGSGKSTLLAAILGEIPNTEGTVHVHGRTAYVSQNAWIQTGTIQENILFGAAMDNQRYWKTLEKCCLVKDLEMLPFGDLTEIGERGVNLSGGQKQRIQLARALYQDADIYLLDDPFSAVDAYTATNLFNDYVMGALSSKTVLLVTHQVDFLPVFDSILLMSDGRVLHAAPYHELLASSKDFQDLVNTHKDIVGADGSNRDVYSGNVASIREINRGDNSKQMQTVNESEVEQLIKKEEREIGDTGLKPYLQYLSQNKGFLYASLSTLSYAVFIAGQISQNSWMAANVENPEVSKLRLILVYLAIGVGSVIFLLSRSLFVVTLGMQSSKSLFSQLLNSLFRAPMSFFDSTPLGRILSRASSDLSIIDLDMPFYLIFSFCTTLNTYCNLGVLAVVTWQVLFVCIPMIYSTLRLQKYYFASSKQLMRVNGTTRSLVANHLAESIAGKITIRAFGEHDRFFAKYLELIDKNASPFFHNFAATEWLIQRLETMSAAVLSSSAFVMAMLPQETFSSGFAGMALSYGLSLNNSLVNSIQNQCLLANNIISVERIHQYTHIASEAPNIIEDNRPAPEWPAVGQVELCDLQIRYRPDSPLVLRGITCKFEGGHKIGIVGRTGSGKTTLISALFRLVEPAGGKIIIDGLNIATIGLHDLRSVFGIIPQEPTLFQGSVRYNLDPLGQHSDQQIWEVLDKCQLREAVEEKEQGLDSLVVEDGSNWSMGQRQLFCLGRVLLRRSRILVLDEATASIDNTTDAILQKTIRVEFEDCTVITVAHRIPTVMDCTRVLAISDGKLVEYDEPMKLMQTDGSLFRELVQEYWSHSADGIIQPRS